MNYPSDNREHECMISDNGKVTLKECTNGQDIKKCSSLCPFYKHENYSSINYGSVEVTEVGRGKVINFAKDFFLPNFYDCLQCDVDDIEFSIVNASKIVVDVSFRIMSKVDRDIDKREVYECDKWKKDAIGIEDNKCPLVGIYSLNELPINIVGGKYKIDDRREKVDKVSNVLFTWMPGSKCVKENVDVSSMPEFPNQNSIVANVNIGNVIEGKNNLILGNLYLNKTYTISFECYYKRENKKAKELNMVLGLFFPFPLVNYHHYTNSISEELQLLDSSECCLVLAKTGRIEKIFVTPMENNDFFVSGNISKATPLSLIEDEFYYNQYAVFLQKFCISLKEKITISSRWNEIPIISSIYNTFNELYDNKYAPISLSIINNTNSIIGLRIVYYLSEYGIKGVEQINIKAKQEMNVNFKPQLSEKELRSICEVTKTLCRVEIFDKDGKCLWNDSNTITILPRETFVPILTNRYRDWKVDLSSYIARWVTPHAPCIDEIIALAGVDRGMSGTLSGNTDIMLQQLKDIYDQISKDVTYITRSMSYGEEWYRTQRVCLPSTTMRLKSGNCIDLAVLLASCYEALNFDVDIVMLVDHAFLKVSLNENYSEFIECTYMGKYEFFEAVEKGRLEFEENFTLDNLPQGKGNVIVNIKHSRKSNILPME